MTDDLDTAVRRAFEREALSAPKPDGLLETVRTGSRRRGVRNGVAGASVAVVAIVGVAVAANTLPFGRSEVAPVSGPGAFGAGKIDLCVAYDEGRLTGLRLAWTRHGRSETEVVEPASRGYAAGGDGQRVRLDVVQRAHRLDDVRPVTVTGRPGRLGLDPDTGDRVLSFESGVRDSLVELTGDGPLVAWAERIAVHADPVECES